jgi:hypothetical protein
LGYNQINNQDEMFKFEELSAIDEDGNKVESYNPKINYYKKVDGIWTWAEELSKSKEWVKAYVKT